VLRMFARVAVAVAIAAGGLLVTTGSATAAQPTTFTKTSIAADDPCGFYRTGNWLVGYNYWYRHCAGTRVQVHITYYDGGFEDTCFGPWEKRQLSWRTNGAHSAGHPC